MVSRKTGLLHRCLLAAVIALSIVQAPAVFAQDSAYVDVTVTRSDAGIIASYTLPTPAPAFTFHEILTEDGLGGAVRDLLRDDTWSLSDPGMVLSGGAVRRRDGKDFDTFDINIQADKAEYGRIYPALVSLGEGAVIGAEYLAAARTQLATRVTFLSNGSDIIIAGEQPPSSLLEIVISKAESYADLDTDEYVVFMGPASYFIDETVRAVVDPAAPKWVADTVLREAKESIAFFEQQFAENVPARPTFLITHVVNGYRPGWRGDVSADGLIAMRLKGEGWATESNTLRRELALFVAHEVNHLWNGRKYAARPSDTWLYEGGAEYMALKSLHLRGVVSDKEMEALLSARANRCIWSRSMDTQLARSLEAGAIYDCGTFIQWIADTVLTTRDGDIFSHWRKLFEIAAGQSAFSTEDFLELLEDAIPGTEAVTAIFLIMGDPAAERFDLLPDLVAGLGIPVRGSGPAR